MSFPDLDWQALKRELDENPSGEISSDWFWDRSQDLHQLILTICLADVDIEDSISEVEEMVHRLSALSSCSHDTVRLGNLDILITREPSQLPKYLLGYVRPGLRTFLENGDRCIHCSGEYLDGRWV